ncbi:MAG: hypothetical protein MUO80_05095 [Dehalococcoidia bacterium]|nr:hypothetical protein [Dehalococcoidia bacterium]
MEIVDGTMLWARRIVFLVLVLFLSVCPVGCLEPPDGEVPPEVEVDEFPESVAKVYLITGPPFWQNLTIDLTGPTTVHVFFEGAVEGEASDNDGDGLDEVSTEIVAMKLIGDSPLGLVEVHLNPTIRSTGVAEENTNNTPGMLDLPPFTTEGTANSYFDVYFELVMGEFVFRTNQPKRMETVISHKPPQEGETYQNLTIIPLVDLYGQPTLFFVGNVSHTPVPPPDH